jgi:enoyl-CoA hydratase
MSANYTVIRIDRQGHVAEVVLNNPAKLNAMAPKFFDEVKAAFEELDADDTVRAIVLWAEGRLFTAGLDLVAAAGTLMGGGADLTPVQKARRFYNEVKHLQSCFTAAEKCRKPVIAAVHGHCIGGGVDLVTACDIRVCTADATFSIYETKIAIVADVGTLQRISRVVGPGMAREMGYTGKRLTADRALRCGMVNEVYPDKDALLEGARAMAQEIAANSPLAVQGTKQVLQYSEQHNLEDGLEYIAQYNAAHLVSNDLTEAISAFMEKRPPVFLGK